MVEAYNSYLAVVPVSGIDHAVSELKRIKSLGLKSVSPHQFPNGSGSPKPVDDRFWDTTLSLDVKISPYGAMGPRTNDRTSAYGEKSTEAFI